MVLLRQNGLSRRTSLLAGMTRGGGLCSGLYNRSDVASIREDEHRLAALLLTTVYDWCVVGIDEQFVVPFEEA
jgi:hypothetical protein